jgi:succinate dehydrogenase/fumarate reductase-like Fe-S protein
MYTRLAALTVAALMTASAASASTLSNRQIGATENTVQCGQLVALTQQTVTEQPFVGPKTTNQVEQLMGKLRDQCSANQFDQADETAAYIRGLIATE